MHGAFETALQADAMSNSQARDHFARLLFLPFFWGLPPLLTILFTRAAVFYLRQLAPLQLLSVTLLTVASGDVTCNALQKEFKTKTRLL